MFKNSPAQVGGLKKFDFITEIGGQRVEKADDAHVLIDRAAIGEVCVHYILICIQGPILREISIVRDRC